MTLKINVMVSTCVCMHACTHVCVCLCVACVFVCCMCVCVCMCLCVFNWGLVIVKFDDYHNSTEAYHDSEYYYNNIKC